jgi:UDP-N-acetylglucosamine:LPS N-acetylglucosamine transferase
VCRERLAAELLKEKGAVVVIDESELTGRPEILKQNIEQLLKDASLRDNLGKKLHDTTMDDAAERIATLLLEIGSKGH